MTLDVDQLKTKLAAKISGSNIELEDMMLLVSAISDITQDRIVSVATPDDLPDLQIVPNTYQLASGNIFFVESIGVLVVSCKSKWVGLDSRVLRDDAVSIIGMAWGSNSNGKLGDGTTVDKSSPVSIIGGITNWSQISGGETNHNLGLTYSGIAYAWGSNSNGRLGDGTTVSKSSPVTVVGGITNWSQVSTGNAHSLGLTDTGIAYAWGYSGSGQLGDGTIIAKSSPVTVVGGITNWSQVSAGSLHSLGLTDTGIAYGWGENYGGRLGDGTNVDKSSPVTVLGGITNWSQVSAGAGNSLGLTDTGIAYAWGINNNGQLGDGTTAGKSSPVTIVGGITNWSQVSAGGFHSLGLTDTGVIYTWGSNGFGGLGDGTTVAKSSPVTVVGGIVNWSQVSAGNAHSLGITDTGVIYAWGYNSTGQLGEGTTINKSSPVTVVGGISTWTETNAGFGNAFGLFTQN